MVLATLAIRFIVELVGVGALAYSAYQVPLDGVARIAVTVAAPLTLVVVWAIVVAPNATNALTQPQRAAIGTGLLVLVAGALAAAGQPVPAAVLGVVVVLNWLLGIVLGQDAATVIASAGGRRQ
jgi:hypothetical protein